MSSTDGTMTSTWPGRRVDAAHGLQAALAVDLDGAVARLALAALVDADDAPRHVVMDRRALPGQPHERDDRQPPARRDVQKVLAIALLVGDAVLGGQPAVVREQRAEARADGVGVVEEAVGVGDEVGQRVGRHAGSDARRRRCPVGLRTHTGRGAALQAPPPGLCELRGGRLSLGGLQHSRAVLVGALVGADLPNAVVVGLGEHRADLVGGQLVVPGPRLVAV